MESNALQVIKSSTFNGVQFDCYQMDGGDWGGTRNQIGRMLDYDDPDNAIQHIHNRNKERLGKFSTRVNLSQVEGTRTVTRSVIIYSFKGLLEICRYSHQPKADAVMDFLWDVADEIRKTGSYTAIPNVAIKTPQDHAMILYANALIVSDASKYVNELAKVLRKNGIKIGAKGLYGWMREKGYLLKSGTFWNIPSHLAMDLGLFETDEHAVVKPDGNIKASKTPKVTPKGMIYFVNKFLGTQRKAIAAKASANQILLPLESPEPVALNG
jgi:phage antirepressor YoqD-like protein